MNSYNEDMELSKKSFPYIDTIYKNVFPNVKSIKRYEKEDESILDKMYHIDTVIKALFDNQITLQEKVLRNEFIDSNTLTIEYMQKQYTKEKGEFFNLSSQYYFSGYWNKNEDGIEKWIIINVPQFFYSLYKEKEAGYIKLYEEYKPKTNKEEWVTDAIIANIDNNCRKTGSSNASFFWIDYNDIPKNCILTSYNIF